MSDTVERVTPGTLSWDEYGEEHMQRYVFFRSLYAGKTVIDAACGTGYGSDFIARNSALRVLGLDVSKEALNFARTNYRSPNTVFKEFDCLKINEAGEKCDLVVSFETIEHLPDPELFIRNVALTLAPGGTFICSTPNKDRLSGAGLFNPFHPSELPWTDFKKIFEKYFDITATYHQSESPAYMRYLELRHLMHQDRARNNAFFFNRLEIWFRKLIGKNFKPIPFFNESLMGQRQGDMVIEHFEKPESWHKTYMIVGTVKK
jgi:SAM-dependent methyltransferase